MSLHVNIAEGCAPTGRILRELLGERGVQTTTVAPPSNVPTEGVVCWGNGYTGRLPSLNRNATQFNKLQQLSELQRHNIQTVPYSMLTSTPATFFPAFARKLSHSGGTDIRVCLEPEHAALYARNGWNYATKYVPNAREFRVWIYRRQHLGTYEKVMTRPAEFLASRRFGANFDNGYGFNLLTSENVPRPAVEMASQAIQQLGLDFGAVDMLLGRDGQYYVLEVNTAPGVEGPDRQVIQMLATKIAWWANHNYPRRNGDEAAYERPSQNRAVLEAFDDDEPETTPAPAPTPRPSFLPRPGETYAAWASRVNT